MGNTKPEVSSNRYEENPEWTEEDFRRSRPALEIIGEVFGPGVSQALRRGPGRPPQANRKVNQTLRLDVEVLEAYRNQGQGWQTRINEILRANMPAGK